MTKYMGGKSKRAGLNESNDSITGYIHIPGYFSQVNILTDSFKRFD